MAGRLLTVASAIFLAWITAPLGRFDPFYAFLAVPVLLLVWPFSNVLHTSQTGFLVAGLIGWSWLLGDRWSAGLPLGCGGQVEAVAVAADSGAVVGGRRRAASGAATALIVLICLGLPFVSLGGIQRMVADAASFRPVSFATPLGLPSWLATVAALGVLVWTAGRTQLIYPWAITVALLAAPFILQHYLPVLVVPLVLYFKGEGISHECPAVRTLTTHHPRTTARVHE